MATEGKRSAPFGVPTRSAKEARRNAAELDKLVELLPAGAVREQLGVAVERQLAHDRGQAGHRQLEKEAAVVARGLAALAARAGAPLLAKPAEPAPRLNGELRNGEHRAAGDPWLDAEASGTRAAVVGNTLALVALAWARFGAVAGKLELDGLLRPVAPRAERRAWAAQEEQVVETLLLATPLDPDSLEGLQKAFARSLAARLRRGAVPLPGGLELVARGGRVLVRAREAAQGAVRARRLAHS